MIEVTKVAFNGWDNCFKVSNDILDLIVTSDVGPRIIFFGYKGEENQFYVKDSEAGITGGETWHSFGGHRLWHAPEDPVRTYYPDNSPVQVEMIDKGVRITQNTEPTGIQKSIEIRMADDDPIVKVNHIFVNHSVWTIPLAVWALSVMHSGGMAVIPHSERIDFPKRLLPTHSLTLWGYTRMDDPRWIWGEKYFYLKQDKNAAKPQKIGLMNTSGWAAYIRENIAFIKQFDFQPYAVYPDLNCNFETYTDSDMLEMESLGPLVKLEPGKSVEHLETWSLYRYVQQPASDADVDRSILPLLKAK